MNNGIRQQYENETRHVVTTWLRHDAWNVRKQINK